MAAFADGANACFDFVESSDCPVEFRSGSVAHRCAELCSSKSPSIRSRNHEHLWAAGLALLPLLFAILWNSAVRRAVDDCTGGAQRPMPGCMAVNSALALHSSWGFHLGGIEHVLP